LRTRRVATNVVVYLVLLLGAAITLGPYLLSLKTSLQTSEQFAREDPLTLPSPITFDNFTGLFGEQYDFFAPIVVTLQMVVVILVGQLVCSVLAAYAFARVRFPGRELLFWFYLATLMVPQVVTLIPLYAMLTTAGLRNTFWGLVLPLVFGSPYAIFLLREYFRGIPEDLVSAARLDGAGTLRIIWNVIVPMSRPILATLTIITVVTHWNSFLWPLMIAAKEEWWVITVATANLQTQYDGNWTLVMAGTTIAMTPLVVVFLLFQRHIVRSISLTGLR
jgi:multiple sugar transport system permease protein